jgi:transposase InsO family protein
VPNKILTDRGANCLAKSLSQYLELQNIKHLKTSPYHPRNNGKTERYNRVLGTMLTKFVGSQKNLWDEFLPQAVFATRIREHTVTKQSPFRLVYGIDPCIPGDSTPPNLSQPTNEEERLQHNESFLNRWEPNRAEAVEAQQRTAEIMKKWYDINKTPQPPLEPGDYVSFATRTDRSLNLTGAHHSECDVQPRRTHTN